MSSIIEVHLKSSFPTLSLTWLILCLFCSVSWNLKLSPHNLKLLCESHIFCSFSPWSYSPQEHKSVVLTSLLPLGLSSLPLCYFFFCVFWACGSYQWHFKNSSPILYYFKRDDYIITHSGALYVEVIWTKKETSVIVIFSFSLSNYAMMRWFSIARQGDILSLSAI